MFLPLSDTLALPTILSMKDVNELGSMANLITGMVVSDGLNKREVNTQITAVIRCFACPATVSVMHLNE